jgi:DNA-binding response OmpR family regulator
MEHGFIIQALVAAVNELKSNLNRLFDRLLLSHGNPHRLFGEFIAQYNITTREFIRSQQYKSNDLVHLPDSDHPMAGRVVCVNGTYLKLHPREDALLRVLVRHKQDLARRYRSGFPDALNYKLRPEDVRDPGALALRLQKPDNAVSQFLKSKFSESTKRRLRAVTEHGPGKHSELMALRAALTDELNTVIHSAESLWDPNRFQCVGLSPETRRLMQRGGWLQANPTHFNRLFLEDAYPGLLRRLPAPFMSTPHIVEAMEALLLDEEQSADNPLGPDAVYRAVKGLRDLLIAAELNPNLIEADRGFGYRLSTPWWNLEPRNEP